MQTLAHWWNGSRTTTRKDVWLEALPGGVYQIRWHGDRWHHRDGSYRTTDLRVATRVLHDLLSEDLAAWREMSASAATAA
jgi:hypothetical protein